MLSPASQDPVQTERWVRGQVVPVVTEGPPCHELLWSRCLVFGLRWDSGSRRDGAALWLLAGAPSRAPSRGSGESSTADLCSQTTGPRPTSPFLTRHRARCAVPVEWVGDSGSDREAGGSCLALRGSVWAVSSSISGKTTGGRGWAWRAHCPWREAHIVSLGHGAGHSLRFLARPSACRVRVQRCTHSEKLRLLWSAL